MNYPDLKEGTVVRALVLIDEGVADVHPGETGTVIEGPVRAGEMLGGRFPCRAVESYGPLVRWLKGATCNVYDGQVEVCQPVNVHVHTLGPTHVVVFNPHGRRKSTRAKEERGGGKRKAVRGKKA